MLTYMRQGLTTTVTTIIVVVTACTARLARPAPIIRSRGRPGCSRISLICLQHPGSHSQRRVGTNTATPGSMAR